MIAPAHLLQRAKDFEREGDINGAIEIYHDYIKKSVDEPKAVYKLALLYHQMGDHQNAIENFKKVAQLTPLDATIWNNLGVLYYTQKDMEEAEMAFKKATACNSKYWEAWYGLGKLCVEQNRQNDARKALLQSLRWNPRGSKSQLLLENKLNGSSSEQIASQKIGFVTIWFERGQSYVTKMFRDVLAKQHETFVFARTGVVNQQAQLETKGAWQVPNLTTHSQYQIPPDTLMKWIQSNSLDVVIFNEEYDWNLIKAAKAAGAKVITYLDYYKEEWKPFMQLYDAVLCSTFRTFDLINEFCNAYFVGWAVESELFKPRNDQHKKFTFFHNAGWLGINYRKMTPAAILAFDAISRLNPDYSLFVHSQAELERLPAEIVKIVKKNAKITFHIETIPAPGLYHKGEILLFPTKLEGLGLPLMEGMSCGMPVIATNAPPMNEFVKDGENGLLVRVARNVTRSDNIAFPETIVDINDLAVKMYSMAENSELKKRCGENAREFVRKRLSIEKFYQRINFALEDLLCA